MANKARPVARVHRQADPQALTVARPTAHQPPPRDWDYRTFERQFAGLVGQCIDLTDPRWNEAPLRADDARSIYVANHVACRRCGEPAGRPCFSIIRGVRVVPERRLQLSHEERLIEFRRMRHLETA